MSLDLSDLELVPDAVRIHSFASAVAYSQAVSMKRIADSLERMANPMIPAVDVGIGGQPVDLDELIAQSTARHTIRRPVHAPPATMVGTEDDGIAPPPAPGTVDHRVIPDHPPVHVPDGFEQWDGKLAFERAAILKIDPMKTLPPQGVDPSDEVEVYYRTGGKAGHRSTNPASAFIWAWSPSDPRFDVVGYRVVRKADTPASATG